MGSRFSFRWTETLDRELRREVKNYNARVRYSSAKYPDIKFPTTLKVSDLKRQIASKRDYNKIINKLSRATSKTLIPGKTGLTKYEESEIKRELKIKKDNEKYRRNKEIASRIMIGDISGRFPDERSMIIKSIGLKENDQANYDKIRFWIDDHYQQSTRWKDNYLKAITNEIENSIILGDQEGLEPLSKLYDFVAKMDLESFLIGQLVYPERLSIKYIYRGIYGDFSDEIERILTYWETLYG